ncbi:hypothetical protein [Streptomyces sp. NPDC101150]|uniref:hypothetical protein n=1 Tax=Streptomyces sp. NPDC101150 TaxID=3366114 RepID=UPI00380621E5
MALIAPTVMSYSTAALPSFTAASASDTFQGPGTEGQYFVVYRNTNAATRTITVVVPGNNNYGQANPDPQYTLAATTGELWIPIHPIWQDSTGVVTITTSAQTNVTVAYMKIQ